jgi:dimeric dUTPase (all-alpha-NTP-PPase superfamily)
MFQLQQELNDRTNGQDWMSGVTKDSRIISWHRCIYMEACEAIDSFNWKHWKDINAQPDWNNVMVELVDIWHFIMSESIRVGDSDYASKYHQIDSIGDLNADKLVSVLEKILALCSAANINKEDNPIREVTDLYFDALVIIGMDVDDLYKRYLVKNQLNIFRQDHGYKDGTYVKFWDAVEDNVIAFNIMEDFPDLTPDQLYKKLEEEYE